MPTKIIYNSIITSANAEVVISAVCLSVCLSVSRITAKVLQLISFKLGVMFTN